MKKLHRLQSIISNTNNFTGDLITANNVTNSQIEKKTHNGKWDINQINLTLLLSS